MADDDERRRVVVVVYPGCTVAEVIDLTTRLVDAGLDVVHAGPDTAAFRDRSGLRIEPDVALDDIDPAMVDAVLVPGGDPGSIVGSDDVGRLLRAVADTGRLVAGICAGVVVMAAAGILRARAVTHNYRAPWAGPEIEAHVAELWTGAEVESDPSVGVVVDGSIITALPNATVDFAMAVCLGLDVYDADRAAAMARHLRGEHVPELFVDPS